MNIFELIGFFLGTVVRGIFEVAIGMAIVYITFVFFVGSFYLVVSLAEDGLFKTIEKLK